MYTYYVIKDGRVLTGFDDFLEASNYAKKIHGYVKENTLKN
jgi:hypothetical protein